MNGTWVLQTWRIEILPPSHVQGIEYKIDRDENDIMVTGLFQISGVSRQFDATEIE